MAYFTQDFNQFFIDLAPNNNKPWFDENRSRYENDVKQPFDIFLADLIEALAEEDHDLKIDPKKCIFRINRDIRFSKDKTPYKMNRSAAISKNGRKDGGWPGIYVQLGPEDFFIAGGAYRPDKDQLAKIREAIAKDPKGFKSAITDKTFVDTYGEIKGEENKRLPTKELMKAAESEPMILKKQFYYQASYPADTIYRDDFIPFIVDKLKAAEKYRAFLKKALD